MQLKSQTLLYETLNGYVLSCQCCNKIQIGFGHFIISKSYEDFPAFKAFVEELSLKAAENGRDHDKRQLVIKFPDGIALRFNESELEELRKLLEWSYAALKVKELLDTGPK